MKDRIPYFWKIHNIFLLHIQRNRMNDDFYGQICSSEWTPEIQTLDEFIIIIFSTFHFLCCYQMIPISWKVCLRCFPMRSLIFIHTCLLQVRNFFFFSISWNMPSFPFEKKMLGPYSMNIEFIIRKTSVFIKDDTGKNDNCSLSSKAGLSASNSKKKDPPYYKQS